MRARIEDSIACLQAFVAQKDRGTAVIDRKEVVAHATLSAFAQHWPSHLIAYGIFAKLSGVEGPASFP